METIGSVIEIELYPSMFIKEQNVPRINSEGCFIYLRNIREPLSREILCIRSCWHNIDKNYMFFGCSDYVIVNTVGENHQ